MMRLRLLLVLLSGVVSVSFARQGNFKNQDIVPGTEWKDTNGQRINAHGGGMLFHQGVYYWYGEYKGDSTYWNPKVRSWECYRTEAGGVSCYSSRDLVNWKFEGLVLKPVTDDPSSDLHPSNVLERPKVIYNESTKKFVMWLHVDSHDYAKAAAGVAVSDSPAGTFSYLGSFRPNGQMSRDMTLFKDDDGKAYQVCSSEENRTLYISRLSDDYLKPSGTFTRNFINQSREAPAIFKRNNKYYLLSSGCTGWDPNQAEYAVSDSMLGKWKTQGNPCTGPDASLTFYGQSTYVLPVEGKKDIFIALFDRWNKKDLIDSRYLWLPVKFNGNGGIEIPWADRWKPQEPTLKETVLGALNQANQYWQANHPPQARAFWDEAAYHTGNMAAFKLTKNERYKNYSKQWAEHNNWMGARSNDTTKWKYNYGETNEHVLFGDWQICYQTYMDLYALEPEPHKIARAKGVIDYQVSTPKNDYWWWADGLYMVMPVMTKLYKITGDRKYLGKLYEYFSYANSIMYDEATGLYYRDAKYVFPKHQSANGKKDFWARGDGWVFAGLAKVLADLPKNDPHRKEYIARYQKMAKTLSQYQQPEGYWTRSILDPAHAPGPETSGTAFFTYGYAWGINNGILSEKEYRKTLEKGWSYLANTALQPDGKIGYVQPIGEKAIPGQVVNAQSTTNFGVGAFLLAATEFYQYVASKERK